MNQVNILGRLTKDPSEKRTVQNGGEVSSFSIAWNRTVNGERESHYFDCVAWNRGNYKLADYATELKKGGRVLIGGELRMREYVPQGETKKQRVYEIVVQSIDNLDRDAAPRPSEATSIGAMHEASHEVAADVADDADDEADPAPAPRSRSRARAGSRA